MSTPTTSLKERHTDATQQFILSSAVELLERSGVSELTVRAVARHAGISERTIFRYYASREEFLDAIATEVERNLQAPAPPSTIDELLVYPGVLYSRFEEKTALVKSALHTDVFKRMREGAGRTRWRAVRSLIDVYAPHRTEYDRKIASANIRHYLSATTWHYYRFYFEFTPSETVDGAQLAIRLAIENVARQ